MSQPSTQPENTFDASQAAQFLQNTYNAQKADPKAEVLGGNASSGGNWVTAKGGRAIASGQVLDEILFRALDTRKKGAQ